MEAYERRLNNILRNVKFGKETALILFGGKCSVVWLCQL